ncbi:MAG: DUF2303 family protein [Clostridiaceae bacterium]|nr:DUF2303 family protein [Clostridiaceae bacterium]
MDTEFNSNTAQTVANLVAKHIAPTALTLVDPVDGTTAPAFAIPGAGGGLLIKPVDEYFEPYRRHPIRRCGTAKMGDLLSFISHVNRFATVETALFANPNKSSPGLLAVLDYHQRVNVADADKGAGAVSNPDAKPAFGWHRTEYKFPLSPEWKAWVGGNKSQMGQAAFAAFIEERILDVLPAPVFGDDLSEADLALKRLSDLLDGKWAGPEKMMELSRGLAIFESAKVINATNINSGIGQIVFQTEQSDGDGQPLSVPNLFLIGIPVFENGAPYRVIVRLRYRRQSGAIAWFYELYRHDKVFEDAFEGACATARQGTGLPLFVGFPEDVA